ncbi:GNAT family N-acetyltransferase [Flindersiella endophytica]
MLAGAMPGAVFVDDGGRPGAVFLHSPEGNFVGGDPANARFVADLRRHLAATFVPERDGDLVLSFDHDGWLSVAPELLPGLVGILVRRRYYVHRGGRVRPRPDLPPGYRIAPIDSGLLRQQFVPGHVRGWIESNWGGEPAFLAGGFGVAALQGEVVAGWSLADCVVADRAEIGIHTAEDHRRRGLAAQVAAAAVAAAYDRGLTQVGWHCNDDNVGSYRTAESVGFTLRRRYVSFAYRR